jgi:glutathione S-transferase
VRDRPYFAGDSVTFPDFRMYEMLYSHRVLAPEVLNKFPSLVVFIKKIEALPRIADFLKSDRSPKPMNNKMASFGNA